MTFGIFEEGECGCDVLVVAFDSEGMAREHRRQRGYGEVRPIAGLSELPRRARRFYAIYYSWLVPSILTGQNEAWSYEDDYADLAAIQDDPPAFRDWENGRGEWTLTVYAATARNAHHALTGELARRGVAVVSGQE